MVLSLGMLVLSSERRGGQPYEHPALKKLVEWGAGCGRALVEGRPELPIGLLLVGSLSRNSH